MRFLPKAFFAVICLFSLQAFSHNKLVSSAPTDQAALTKTPQYVQLNFNTDTRLLKLELRNSSRETVAIGFEPTIEKSSVFTTKLPELEAGTYQVKWIATSGDSHKINGAFSFAVQPEPVDSPLITVYKSATCGCCKAWVSHLERNGFTVQAHDVGNMYEYKVRAKLGAGLGSCHTAFVDGYAVEGHVPAEDLKRMLREKPDISGLTVPGMPVGSPGMEMPGRLAAPFQVMSYKDGKVVGVFSDYPAGSVFK